MTDPILGGTVDKALTVALNGLAARHRAISNNLANVDTPGFKASGVVFEEQLKHAVARGGAQQSTLLSVSRNSGHLPIESDEPGSLDSVHPKVFRQGGLSVRMDGNNVDIDKEMVELAEATIAYNSLVQLVSARVSMARYAVNEGRR